MANRRARGNTYEGVIIDTAPGAGGYYCTAVKAKDKKVHALIMDISGIWAGTVTLQYRAKDNVAWAVYDTYTASARNIVEDYTDCEWRIGVASGGYTSGTIRTRLEFGEY